jgi:hypothetical protein
LPVIKKSRHNPEAIFRNSTSLGRTAQVRKKAAEGMPVAACICNLLQ